jgi:hypothetical protein
LLFLNNPTIKIAIKGKYLGLFLAFLGIKKARKEDLAGKKVAPIQGTKENRMTGELIPASRSMQFQNNNVAHQGLWSMRRMGLEDNQSRFTGAGRSE